MIHFNTRELELIRQSLVHDNTPEGMALRQRIRYHLNAIDFVRHIKSGGEVATWTPPLSRQQP